MAVKSLCVRNWDANNDNEISYSEIENITKIAKENSFMANTLIQVFKELKYFKNLEIIYKYAFENCPYLWQIELPESIGRIELRAFADCKSLTNLVLPKNLRYIHYSAFGGCVNLKTIRLNFGADVNMSMVSDASGPFGNIDKGQGSVTVFADCNIPHYLFNGSEVDSLVLGPNVKIIGNQSFGSCLNFVKLSLPQSIEVIGEGAFSYCNFNKVHLGKNVREIGAKAFFANNKYFDFYCEAVLPPSLGMNAFGDVDSYQTIKVSKIYVPMESVNRYKEEWVRYKDRIVGYNF